MDKVKVIFRQTADGEIIAFFPEVAVNRYNIMSYMHIGQHSEASIELYKETKVVSPEKYKPLLSELKGIYNDCELTVKRKIYYKDLEKVWR